MSFWGTRPSPFTSNEATILQGLADLSFAQGDIVYINASGQFARLAAGTNGNVLTTAGAGANPAWGAAGGGLTVGSTTIASGTNARILYDNSGVLGEMTTTGSGTVVALATSPSLVTPALGVATATSLAIGGATIGTNGLAVAGHILVEGVTSTGATGSNLLVFATSPTLTTPVLGVASATSLATSAGSPLLMTNGQLLTVTITSQTTGGATLTIPDFASVSDEFVFKTKSVTMSNKTFVAPVLGAATATSINGNTFTSGSYTLTGQAGKTLTFNGSITLTGTDAQTYTFPGASDTMAALGTAQTFTAVQTFTPAARSSGVAAYFTITTPTDTAQTAATESAGIKVVTATRTWATTGTVALQREIFFAGPTYASASASQTFTDATTLYITPPVAGSNAIFTRGHSLVIVDATSAASSITGGLVISATVATTATSVGIGGGNINAGGTLTVGGHVTLEGVTSTGATGTGKLVFDGTPTLVTPVLGTPTSGTLTNCTGLPIAGLVASTSTALGVGSIELGHATDTTITRVSSGLIAVEGSNVGTMAAAQVWTGQNKFNNIVDVSNAITASSNAATVPVTFRLNTVTNNSAATLTITMTTTSAVDGQMTVVRILDSSAAAQTITWVNTENSTVTAPTTSNGSTTLFLTVGFIYNSGTSKWRCIASA